MSSQLLTKELILDLFNELNEALKESCVIGELYVVGGAVMCLAFNARPSTKDIDSYFEPKEKVRKAAKQVAQTKNIDEDWLNDAVKGYLSENADFKDYLSLSNLKIFVASPEYLLAMKCLSMRLGAEFLDEADVRFLLRYLNIEKYQDALDMIARYYPLNRFPQKTLYALEELLK